MLKQITFIFDLAFVTVQLETELPTGNVYGNMYDGQQFFVQDIGDDVDCCMAHDKLMHNQHCPSDQYVECEDFYAGEDTEINTVDFRAGVVADLTHEFHNMDDDYRCETFLNIKQ